MNNLNNQDALSKPLKHGGNLNEAIQKYNFAYEQWLDLSTGISPWQYPIDKLPDNVWRDLPDLNIELLKIACDYYNCNEQNLCISPGSQLAIRLIPQLLNNSQDAKTRNKQVVAIPRLGYQEHMRSWQLAGYTTCSYNGMSELEAMCRAQRVDHALIINPNNPSCQTANQQQINLVSQLLAENNNGLLIIDEAFIDAFQLNSSHNHVISMCSNQLLPNQIVLRSLGKFFGLAGLRVGFVISKNPVIQQLNSLLQPWSISHASCYIAKQALADHDWQQHQSMRIFQQNDLYISLLHTLCKKHLSNYTINTAGLFSTVFANKTQIEALHKQLAQQAIWTRLFNQDDTSFWLRFSLPKNLEVFQHKIDAM